MNKNSFPTYDLELELINKGYDYIVGVDEVARGAGAGPVVATAVVFPADQVENFIGKVKDSKKLTEKRREVLYDELVKVCDYGIGSVSNVKIDQYNIYKATKMAMVEAISYLRNKDFVLIDGNMFLEDMALPQKSIVKGDNVSITIATASIIAKVVRDTIMKRLSNKYPVYGWGNNKGYLTKQHCEAIKEYGTTPYHRMSFNKVG